MASPMILFFVSLVANGKKKVEDIPEVIREDVQNELEKSKK